jgi:hypothetical protein
MNEPPTIALKDLLDLVEKVESRINSYWNFYMIALFAIGAWIFDPGKRIDLLQASAIVTALIVFFSANLTLININESRLSAIESEIKSVTTISQIESEKFRTFLLNSSIPNRQKLSKTLHLSVDVIMIILIFIKGIQKS